MARLFSGLTLPRVGGQAALPLWGGLLALMLAAGFFVALPDWRLEQLVEASGLARILPLAQPPLGDTARLLLALVAGVLAGAIAWSALFLLVGPGGMFHRDPVADRARPARPSVRRADAHPDAPPRHPLTAAELGTPPPPVAAPPAERGLPADLDQPLAAFDPAAIPDVPREPVRPVAPIAPLPVPPPPPPSPPPPPIVAPAPIPMPHNDDPSPSIAALLDRLERGTRRRR